MTRILSSTVAAVALAGLVGVSAQTSPQPTERQQKPSRSQAVTVAGCLDQAEPSSSRESGRDVAGSAPFVLKNVQGGTASSYALIPTPDADLTKHLNHQVQITGMLTKPPTEVARSSSATSDRGGDSSSGGSMPTLTVQSVKMVSSSCG